MSELLLVSQGVINKFVYSSMLLVQSLNRHQRHLKLLIW